MQIIRLILAIVLLLGLLACSDFDVKEMFALHASPAVNGEAMNLRGGKVPCLHCPMYFAFDARPPFIAKVVAQHKMSRVASLPKESEELEALVQRNASWWQSANHNGQDEIYWVAYAPTHPTLEPAFRLLVVKGTHAFLITSGYFASEYYVPEKV